jgi:hypothetical protein
MPENRPQCGLIKTPHALEIGARRFEGRGGVGLMFFRMRVWIEAAALFPRIGVMGISHALGNRPDVNIAVVNVPAVMTVVFGAAAGEFRMGLRVCQSRVEAREQAASTFSERGFDQSSSLHCDRQKSRS